MCWICDASAPQCKLAMVESPEDFCAGWDLRCRFIPHPWRKVVLQNEVPQPSTSEGTGKVKKSTPPTAPSRIRAKRPVAKPSFPNPIGLWNLDPEILCWDSGCGIHSTYL